MDKTHAITVKQESDFPDAAFRVVVSNGSETSHLVRLTDHYCRKLVGEKISPEELIRKSFEFLLEREPNTSILQEFHLYQISSYFPEYEKTIKNLL
ncbi:MAG: hypothetical protein A3C80_00825 [Candidatus Ryanbacteria bacterium RIFCSPHIGHO2_02_FULL_45_43]|uniref:Uncharacterized protein n=1 Tax=Candidatus Ryanbacteria bacterium RIFCSPHIGHO2_01_45_13 TaxID=1802112 RepID=A0A1G2FZ51_9BACT|nr:MAG: hypothetical protein A2718_03935 [Candidatus Ryanbacteria bacterium RIFCSPHIGHO2_01_FULL_44_130]OGZ43355.1 MAG: hypothetical protein A2W41_04515 [Candidatus Ryanbacteria bacterium RIFCSPHIGHO2_01_45_13]OGZ48933.1 MAG: hypothetical protein A3C80_00825 [Candidatus Ryanbacteria bacterium RIFCSPHIGHO2_02_FULL_45_43]OGZ50901.1 MAG: hypothetical protein A3E55_02910 [Candidatus Ryanbacteria bacterium RIFCSPHIGHO2_12_FULL_44_20]OGZ51749.1 MAG: hypothetical protein A3A17_00010 [Candidatus Ryanba